jgi:hypothetical protein
VDTGSTPRERAVTRAAASKIEMPRLAHTVLTRPNAMRFIVASCFAAIEPPDRGEGMVDEVGGTCR